jgi:hypothetical protein
MPSKFAAAEDTTITRSDGAPASGNPRGSYSITKVDGWGATETTEYDRAGRELARYEGHPHDVIPAPAKPSEPAGA